MVSLFKYVCNKIKSKCIGDRAYDDERELPDDIWALILGKVWIGDRVRCRLVCKAWNLLLKSGYVIPALEPPWQLILLDFSRGTIKIWFQSMSENRIYSFDVPACYWKQNKGRCWGSSGGWILMEGISGSAVLWDPISGTVRELPDLPSRPDDKIKRVEVFSTGSTECVVAVICRFDIMICTPKDARWTIIENGRYYHFRHVYYLDLLFHPEDGVLYALAVDIFETEERRREDYLVRDIEIPLQSCCLRVRPLFVSKLYACTPNQPELHMVKSLITREVLVVAAVTDPPWTEPIRFEVAQLPVSGAEKMVTSIGEQAIFYSETCSFSYPIGEGLLPDCIYFTTTFKDNYPLMKNKNGVFSIQEKTMQLRARPIEDPVSYRRYVLGWFTPQLPDELFMQQNSNAAKFGTSSRFVHATKLLYVYCKKSAARRRTRRHS